MKICNKHPELEGATHKNGQCSACCRERTKAWCAANPIKAKEAKDKWARENREKVKASIKNWVQNNTEKAKALQKAWVKANPERVAEAQRKYDMANKAKRSAKNKKYCEDNPEYFATKTARRRAAKLKATPKWANSFYIEEAYHLALLRTKALGIVYHVDHIVPLISPLVCGLHCEQNIQLIPAFNNMSKGNRHWPDMPT